MRRRRLTSSVANFPSGTWKELTLDPSSQASPFDASQLIQISIDFSTGSGPDGGVFGAPAHAVFHVDAITWRVDDIE